MEARAAFSMKSVAIIGAGAAGTRHAIQITGICELMKTL